MHLQAHTPHAHNANQNVSVTWLRISNVSQCFSLWSYSNKARGFELKRPKFMPPANVYSDADEDDDDDEDEHDDEQVVKEQEPVVHKPKLRYVCSE